MWRTLIALALSLCLFPLTSLAATTWQSVIQGNLLSNGYIQSDRSLFIGTETTSGTKTRATFSTITADGVIRDSWSILADDVRAVSQYAIAIDYKAKTMTAYNAKQQVQWKTTLPAPCTKETLQVTAGKNATIVAKIKHILYTYSTKEKSWMSSTIEEPQVYQEQNGTIYTLESPNDTTIYIKKTSRDGKTLWQRTLRSAQPIATEIADSQLFPQPTYLYASVAFSDAKRNHYHYQLYAIDGKSGKIVQTIAMKEAVSALSGVSDRVFAIAPHGVAAMSTTLTNVAEQQWTDPLVRFDLSPTTGAVVITDEALYCFNLRGDKLYEYRFTTAKPIYHVDLLYVKLYDEQRKKLLVVNRQTGLIVHEANYEPIGALTIGPYQATTEQLLTFDKIEQQVFMKMIQF